MSKKINGKSEIPIFFATDDNYVPFLEVALTSLLDNASRDYFYSIFVLSTNLKQESKDKISSHGTDYSKIEFIEFKDAFDNIQNLFHLRDYYSKETYYRFFIPDLLPQYDKVLYLDCDICVAGDISELYNTDIKGLYGAVAQEEVLWCNKEFSEYAPKALGIRTEDYFNAGVFLMNTKKFRKDHIAQQFLDLSKRFVFRIIQDEDYLNVLCQGKVKMVGLEWNKTSFESETFKMEPKLVHYKIIWRPWKYENVKYEDLFFKYAEMAGVKDKILAMRAAYTDADRERDQQVMAGLSKMVIEDANDPNNYYNQVVKPGRNKHGSWFAYMRRIRSLSKLISIKSLRLIYGKRKK